MTTTIRGRIGGRPGSFAVLLLLLSSVVAIAQPARGQIDSATLGMAPFPLPADVLTPNTRQNTPYLKIGVRAGLNWAAYSNDRYLDNTALDVGLTSGESEVYSNAAGFGFGGGAEIEYPINTGISIVGTVEYARANFGKEGAVRQECVPAPGSTSDNVTDATHDWSAHLDYLKIGASVRLSFPSFYVLGGLTGDRLLASTLTRHRVLDDRTCSFVGYPGEWELTEETELPDPSGIHFALRLGFGFSYPVMEGLTFSPELTLDFGLSSINKSPESDLDMYSVSGVLRYELR
jgi:hypothetical protein